MKKKEGVNVRSLFLTLVVGVAIAFVYFTGLVSCEQKDSTQSVAEISPQQSITSENDSEEENKSVTKSDVEAVVEAGNQVADFISEKREERRKRDSLKLASKEESFAYELGFPIDGEKKAIEAYEELMNTDGIYIFKKSKSKYQLVKFESKSEEELNDSINSFKEQNPGMRVQVVNLTTSCDLDEVITTGGDIGKRRKGIQIPCLICK
ncbi:MAG: hypothetical protein ACJ76F_11905 [Bacteroidia bacterium]